MTFVSKLEPEALWRHFDHILTIPRPSKHEKMMRQFIVDLAERTGYPHQTDEAGNLVIRKPATSGKEGCPVTILQSHLDMVCEKNSDVEHDFFKDPIQPRQEADYLIASGTTLGSDNGIGIAAMLAVLEASDLTHGPLELLFTVDEETGLTGAKNLDASMLEGRRLINLDSENEGVLCVGCAGGADSHVALPLTTTAVPSGSVGLRLHVSGLQGGHSGIDIHLQRGNATQLLARALHAVSLSIPFHLSDLEGGNMHNAIPREAFATVLLAEGDRPSFLAGLEAEIEAIREEYRSVEPAMSLKITDEEVPERVWDQATGLKVLQLLTGLPHGVLVMSYDIPGLVETSTNLATVAQADGALRVDLSTRSSVASALTALRQKIRAIASLAGATVEEEPGYPGWKPDLDSELLRVVQSVHQRALGSEPEIEAVHAGLECGLIGEMIPGMDMISFGPQIEFPHSPNERVKTSSVKHFYKLLTETLKELATGC